MRANNRDELMGTVRHPLFITVEPARGTRVYANARGIVLDYVTDTVAAGMFAALATWDPSGSQHRDDEDEMQGHSWVGWPAGDSGGEAVDGAIIRHPAFAFLSDPTAEAARPVASQSQVLLRFERAGDVQAASDELREWDPSGRKYEHHVRDNGNIVIDWE